MKSLSAVFLCLLSVSVGAQELPMIEKVYQDLGEKLEASVGGQVFKVVRRAPIKNQFGKADMFGRAIDRGTFELLYQGLTRDGKVVLRAIDEDPLKKPASGAQAGNAPKSKAAALPAGIAAMVQGATIPVAGQDSKPQTLPGNITEVALDLSKKKNFQFGSVVVSITQADKNSLKYTLQQVSKGN